jgi:molybdate transport system ATP-binding protein
MVMCHNSHIGIYLSNASNKKLIINRVMTDDYLKEYLDFGSSSCALFSTITVERMLDEELRHDRIVVSTAENKQGLQTMSSGQQKKAVLQYLIAQQPSFLVLDDVYANVDKATQAMITHQLENVSKQMTMIQLFFRKRDVLSNIDYVLTVNEQDEIVNVQSKVDFLTSKDAHTFSRHVFKLPTQYSQTQIDIDPLIQLNDVSVSYGDKHVLDRVSWTVRKGEFWQLIGPNGSGKSTLVTMISGDNPKAYGQDMTLFGRKKGSGETIWDIKKQIGYFTPSLVQLFKHDDTVENMIVSGMVDSIGLYQLPTDIQKRKANEWIAMLGPSFVGRSFQSLSIGQQRMVMVARAMVKHPPLLILDEPTIELDDENTQVFVEMVNAIAAEKQIAIIYVSHQDEDRLKPAFKFELIPDANGYTGVVGV